MTLDATAASAGIEMAYRFNQPVEALPREVRLAIAVTIEMFATLQSLRMKACRRERIAPEELETVNRFLRRATWHSKLTGFGARGEARWEHVVDWVEFPSGKTLNSMIEVLAHGIADLAEANLLNRVRQCEGCFRWFFAINPKKRFCNEDGQDCFKKTEVYRIANAKRQRESRERNPGRKRGAYGKRRKAQ